MLIVLTLATAAVAACGKTDRQSASSADSVNRDLQLAPADTASPRLNDRPAAEPAQPAAPAPASHPKTTRPKTRPAPTQAAAAPSHAAAAPSNLAVGTVIQATLKDSISSRSNKPGDVVEATTTADIKDASGRTVIPKGAIVALTITDIKPSGNKSDKTGTLTLTPSELRVNGKTYRLAASIDAVDSHLQGRATNVNDVAKVGAGTAIGAIVGRVIGGSTKGAIIGGVIGGAVGTQRAIETKDRDVVVPAGSTVKMTLKEPLSTTA
jgi:hypothetical protein